MNLVTHPWIPVILKDGTPKAVSLERIFADSKKITDLSLTPPERIAVTNLLLCIAHRALDGPRDHSEHKACRNRIVPEALAYLRRSNILPAFELLGPGPRFLQVHGAGKPGTASLAKLAGVDDKGTTLFQPDTHAFRSYSPEWTALRLLVFQSYSPGGKVGGSEETGGRAAPVSAKAGPRRDSNAIHAFLRGENLLETIWLNLVPYSELSMESGEPAWELLQRLKSPKMHNVQEDPAAEQLPRTHLGRLVPLSRSIWLDDALKTAELTKALDHPGFGEGFRDFSITTVVAMQKKQPVHVPLSCAKGGKLQQVWRSLHSVLLVQASENDPKLRGPLTLANAESLPTTSGQADLWLGGLGGDQASTIDFFESSYQIPAQILCEEDANRNWRDAYQTGVKLADNTARQLNTKVFHWCRVAEKTLEKANPGEFKRFVSTRQNQASDHFWSVLQTRHHTLVEEANKAVTSPTKSLEEDWNAPWPRLVRSTADEAFQSTCPARTRIQTRARALAEERQKFPAS